MSKFLELAKSKIKDNKNVVISMDTENNSICIAQQLVINDEGQITNIYLKHSIITDVNGLNELKNAIDLALEKVTQKD